MRKKCCYPKKVITAAIWLLATAFLHADSGTDADRNIVFTPPQFTEGESIIGIGGWALLAEGDASNAYNVPESATLISSPIGNSEQQAALELKTSIWNPLEGFNPEQQMNLEASFAITFHEEHRFPGGINFWFGRFLSVTPFRFGFEYGADGGLFFARGEEVVVILKREEVEVSSLYHFSIAINLDDASFQVSARGKKRNGEPFEYQSETLGFAGNYDSKFLGKGISISNDRPTVVNGYIESIHLRRASGDGIQ